MGGAIFDPTQNPHPLTDHQKFVASDYVGDPYGSAKFGANPSTGGFSANGWNITKFFYLCLFFGNSPTGQTRRQIFTLDGSNDTNSHKGVPFEGFVDIAPNLGGESPKTPILRGE